MTMPNPSDKLGEGEGVALGVLGSVDHHANLSRSLIVEHVGRQYRLAWSEVTDGCMTTEPADDELFDSIYIARAALRERRAALSRLNPGE